MRRVATGRNRAAARREAIATVRRRGDGSDAARSNGQAFLYESESAEVGSVMRSCPCQTGRSKRGLTVLANKRTRIPGAQKRRPNSVVLSSDSAQVGEKSGRNI